mmetsp:Transcript_43057/g.93593  ORF Transcript_43057/g.93593 Transcript_43057/m.93593 type:complete len:139 (+) Transcript_43057:61-477(+)
MMMEDTTTEQLLTNCTDLEDGNLVKGASNVDGVTLEEVAEHNQLQDAWIILNGEVLDVTRWIPLHPGGEQTIARVLGKDASMEWNMIHAPGTIQRNARFLKNMGRVIERNVEEAPARGLFGAILGMGCCKRRRPSAAV